MNTNIPWAKVIAFLQIAYAAVGFLTGWINPNEALTIGMIGLGVFGFHMSNVQLGNKLGRQY